jgi:hypothetical protein
VGKRRHLASEDRTSENKNTKISFKNRIFGLARQTAGSW